VFFCRALPLAIDWFRILPIQMVRIALKGVGERRELRQSCENATVKHYCVVQSVRQSSKNYCVISDSGTLDESLRGSRARRVHLNEDSTSQNAANVEETTGPFLCPLEIGSNTLV